MKYSILIIIGCIVSVTTFAQVQFQPPTFTNRRLGFINDASATAWNPALLGLNSGGYDILGALEHGKDVSDNSTSRLHLFAKLGPVGFGYSAKQDSTSPTAYMGGLGFTLNKSRTMLLGVSGMYRMVDSLKVSDNLRANVSVICSPYNMVWLSAGVNNMYTQQSDIYVGSVAAAFTPVSWASLHGSVDIATKTGVFKDDMLYQAGISLVPLDFLTVSAMTIPQRESYRIGVELKFDGYTLGELYNSPKTGNGDGVFLVRYQDDDNSELPVYAAALRSGRTTGSSYGSRRDAVCRPTACKWLDKLSVDPPSQLMNKMQMAGSDYSDFYGMLHAMSPNHDSLYSIIGQKYYGVKPTMAGFSSGKTSIVRSVAGYDIVVDTIVKSQVETTVIFRVRDANGRTVSGLKRESFILTDTNQQVTQFSQVASQKKVAADFMILMDCSGSMGTQIASVRTNVQNFARSLANRNIDYRIGSILYKEDVFATLAPTTNLNEFNTFFAQAAATGYDEITSEAIAHAATIPYRDSAEKIAILITDDCSYQDNTDYSEKDVTEKLWNKGVHLYGVINPDNHNAGFTTRLTLGKEYSIKNPFNSILDDISGEITTTYQISYKEKPPVVIPTTILRGVVQSESGWNLAANIEAVVDGKSRQTYKTNALSGEYEFEVPKGKRLELNASADDHSPEKATVQVPNTNKFDTLTQNFTLKQPRTILKGVVMDENKTPKQAKIKIEDATTLALVKEIETNANGAYSIEIPEGNIYRLTPSVKEYIPTPADVDMRTTKKGSVITQDLMVTSIATAIEKGMTFKLKNLFFDTGKWDLRPESFEEMNKLLSFLNEYQTIRIEIGAHTDNVGSDASNNTLSQKRAQSAVDYLKSKGIPETRMTAKGYGKTVPVADNATPEGRQLNRRVEFKLIK